MKILWLSHFLLFPETGFGGLQRSRNLLTEVARQHEVYLLSYFRKRDLAASLTLEDARKDLGRFCKKIVFIPFPPDKNRLFRSLPLLKSLVSNTPYSAYLYQSNDFIREALDLIHQHQIDLVHSDTLGLMDAAADHNPVLKVLNHQNIESDMMFRRCRKEKNLFKKLFLFRESINLRNYEKRICPSYDLNLVVSDIDGEKLRKGNPDINPVVIENGVNGTFFPHLLRDDRSKGLIFTGQLDWYPNRDAMIYFCGTIWPKLQEKFPDLRLTIIGKNPPNRLLRLTEKDPAISILGFVPDIRDYVKKAGIFICPILDGGGTRLKILDALAQGIPVVSTDIGCEGLKVKNGEHLLIANSPEEFVEQIGRLLTDPELSNKLSRKGRVLVEEHYLFEKIGKKLSKVYEQLSIKGGN